jgi:hypothetical protein
VYVSAGCVGVVLAAGLEDSLESSSDCAFADTARAARFAITKSPGMILRIFMTGCSVVSAQHVDGKEN